MLCIFQYALYHIITEGITGAQQAVSGNYHLILLDLMLSGMDNFEICRSIRIEVDIPILMFTARLGDTDKIRGLWFGVDDYIFKPFYPNELVTSKIESGSV